MADALDADVPEQRSELMAISNAVVHLYKEQLGRGPTKARTAYAGSDAIVVTLENTMVPAERKLVELGEGHRMEESRLIAMRGAEAEFCEAVEQRLLRATLRHRTEAHAPSPARGTAPGKSRNERNLRPS